MKHLLHNPNNFETFFSKQQFLDLDQLSAKLKKTREDRQLNRSQIAMLLGISSQLYGQYEDGKRIPKMPFFLKWKEKFNEDLIEANVSHVGEKAEAYNERSLNNLTESNKVLAEANRTLAEANKTLAEANHVISKNHDELIQLTKMIVANSTASQQVRTLQQVQHTDRGKSAEDFLPPGTDLSKPVKKKEAVKK